MFILFTVLVGVSLGIIGVYYAKRRKLKADAERRAKRAAEYQAKFDRMIERDRERDRKKLVAIQPAYSRPQVVRTYSEGIQPLRNNHFDRSSNDLLNAMLMNHMLMTDQDRVTATVSWSDNTPTITEQVESEPERKSSSTSSYFSGSSGDSSYSSSSSDSSYSSSDSSSSSWD